MTFAPPSRNTMVVREETSDFQNMKDTSLSEEKDSSRLMMMKDRDNSDDEFSNTTDSSSNNSSSQDFFDVVSGESDDDEKSLDLNDISESAPVHDVSEIILITDSDEGYHGDSSSDEEYLTPDECDEDLILNSILQTASHVYSSQPLNQINGDDSQSSLQLGRKQQRRGSSESTLIVPRRLTSVSWSTQIVTEIRHRPYTTEEEKETFYYTSDDMIRFRREYKCFQRAQQAAEEDYLVSRMSSSRLVESPISGLINMATSYMTAFAVNRSNSPVRGQNNLSPSRRHASENNGTLVDTLYLF